MHLEIILRLLIATLGFVTGGHGLRYERKGSYTNKAANWVEDAIENRKEMVKLQNTLNRFKRYEELQTMGASAANIVGKIFGRLLIISALIDDIDLGSEGMGSLEIVYGG